MASPNKTGSSKHEIVARFDQVCWKCRGKCFEGSRIWWDKATSLVEHVTCPPVLPVAEEAYRPPPVSPDLWKRYCKELADMMAGKNTARVVVDEYREAFKRGGAGALLASIINRTRCTGQEAVEIGRRWIDELKKPVDEDALLKANERLKAGVTV